MLPAETFVPASELRNADGTFDVLSDNGGSYWIGDEFDLARGAYTGRRLDDPRWAIGDAISVDRDRLLVIERDGSEGASARVKKDARGR